MRALSTTSIYRNGNPLLDRPTVENIRTITVNFFNYKGNMDEPIYLYLVESPEIGNAYYFISLLPESIKKIAYGTYVIEDEYTKALHIIDDISEYVLEDIDISQERYGFYTSENTGESPALILEHLIKKAGELELGDWLSFRRLKNYNLYFSHYLDFSAGDARDVEGIFYMELDGMDFEDVEAEDGQLLVYLRIRDSEWMPEDILRMENEDMTIVTISELG